MAVIPKTVIVQIHKSLYYFFSTLGEDEEAQLQNLILRALGQIMLYVDGMNGVMENPRAIQFLYKLVLASNPLGIVFFLIAS